MGQNLGFYGLTQETTPFNHFNDKPRDQGPVLTLIQTDQKNKKLNMSLVVEMQFG